MIVNDVMRSRFPKCDMNDPISALLGKMKRSKSDSAVVFDKKKYKGMVSKRGFLKSRFNPKEMKVKRVVVRAPKLSRNMDLMRAAKLMESSDLHMLPVLDGERVVGILKASDIMKNLRNKVKSVFVDDIATSRPIVFKENDEIGKAIYVMNRKKFDRFPVVDRKKVLIGIVSLLDIIETKCRMPVRRPGGCNVRRYGTNFAKQRDLLKLPISNQMRRSDVVTAKKKDRLGKIIDLMVNNHCASVVLVEDRRPVGIVTVKDILKEIRRAG